jgi:hypothetical protein
MSIATETKKAKQGWKVFGNMPKCWKIKFMEVIERMEHPEGPGQIVTWKTAGTGTIRKAVQKWRRPKNTRRPDATGGLI